MVEKDNILVQSLHMIFFVIFFSRFIYKRALLIQKEPVFSFSPHIFFSALPMEWNNVSNLADAFHHFSVPLKSKVKQAFLDRYTGNVMELP